MGRVRSSKSYDADANNSHRRTVSSLNIAHTEESRSNKSSSIASRRSASSLRKDQRFQRHIISQNTSQIRVADVNEKNHQGKFVDARLLPKLDFVRKTLSQTSGSLGMITRPRII
ncbi:cell division protein FtsQ, partial [Gardnerella vaginalis]